MSSITKKAGLIFAVGIIFIASCKQYDETRNINAPTPDLTQSANANNAANLAKDDAEELNEIIKLPFEPDEEATVWRETSLAKEDTGNRIPAPTDKKLVAVMKFNEKDTEKLIELVSSHLPPPQPAQTTTETWFPAELTAVSSLSGNETLKGTAYSAKDFLKTPYTQGRLIKVDETDYFILELTAM